MTLRSAIAGLALATALCCNAAPSRAADEPVATAPIPPPLRAEAPAIVPISPRAAPAPTKPAAAIKAAKAPAPERKREHSTAERRRPVVRDAAETSRHPKRSASAPAPERRPARQQATAIGDEPRAASYRLPRRDYREEVVRPPFPPPWYDRGPPFAAMPYPRGPMPPW
jgi:hypothetical protein